MTQPINTFQDILNALEREPELHKQLRQHILTEDLLKLPAVVGLLEEGEAPVTDQLRGLHAVIGPLEEGEEPVTSQLRSLHAGVRDLQASVGPLEEGEEPVTSQLRSLQASVGERREEDAPIFDQLRTMNGSLRRLTGADYEGRTAQLGYRRIMDSLHLQLVTLVYRHLHEGRERLMELMRPALAQGAIDENDLEDLENVDLIFRGQNGFESDAPARYVVTEVSVTTQEGDVGRARRRAGIMRSAPGLDTAAAVIGTAITPEARQALGSDVTATGMDPEGRPCQLAVAESERTQPAEEEDAGQP